MRRPIGLCPGSNWHLPSAERTACPAKRVARQCLEHRADCILKTEETDAKASAGDVERFATHDNLLSIQNADPLNGVGEPVVGIAGDEPVTNTVIG